MTVAIERALVAVMVLTMFAIALLTASLVVDKNYNGLSLQVAGQQTHEDPQPAIRLSQCP